MTNKQSGANKPHSSNDELGIEGDVTESVIIKGNKNTVIRGVSFGTVVVIIVLLLVIALLVGVSLGGDKAFSLEGGAGLSSTATASETPTPTSTNTEVPNDTVEVFVPDTETPLPTLTFTPTPIPPVAIGEDWLQGCVSTLWRMYPATVPTEDRGDGCWREPVGVFSAENGDLDFLAQRDGNGPAEVYGLFAPLPESGSVTFTIRLRDLTNADLQMGIYSQPDVNSPGLLMTILNGDVSRRSFVQKNPLNYETMQGTVALDQNNGYSITFSFNALSAISEVNPSVFVTNPVSLPSNKWLFLGYKGLRGSYRVEGTFLQFEISQ